MEGNVKIIFELSKDYIQGVMAVTNLTKDPQASKVLEKMDVVTVSEEELDDICDGDSTMMKMGFALLAVGKKAKELGV